ncbi:hypothetical protein NE237_002985 [Protea cynaroides]|uniref:NAB domain-containing protein n=1 Tax=Protea cynaroides TaxID=273540 RepID=A0A9Q0KGJ0_9MAGN|nr:hypothetical protein NE237_002985 [Protea cynaroides]
MEILRREKLTMNLFKCIFVTDSVIFLAFVVSANGQQVDQELVQAIVEWPRPKTIGEVPHCFFLNFATSTSPECVEAVSSSYIQSTFGYDRNDMDEKVKQMIKLIEEDGDSFARRAEMYYKRRPEIINLVEESYRAYRALAERYDHISGDLQNANKTLGTVFPEQVQFATDDEDDDGSSRTSTSSTNQNSLPNGLPESPKLHISKLPSFPRKDAKGPSTLLAKKVQPQKATSSTSINTTTNSLRMSTAEALQEIDSLQKGILVLQTEKEFVKSSYESGVAKYWEIEKRISEMHETVCMLQDDFCVATVIEDDEARTIMGATALKSCQETLVQLQEKQKQSAEEARVEYQRIKDAREKLRSIKNEFHRDQTDQPDLSEKRESIGSGSSFNNLEQEVSDLSQGRLQSESIQEKIREHFDMNSDTCLTVTELAEKIDELVHKVISLEITVSSQTALINRLRSETDELQENLQNLDEDKATLGSFKLVERLRKMDEKLYGIQDLNQNFEDQNNNLQTHFTEAHSNLNYLTKKLHSMKPDEEFDIPGSPLADMDIIRDARKQEKSKEQKDMVTSGDGLESTKVGKAEAEEQIAVQNLSPCSKDNEEDSIESMIVFSMLMHGRIVTSNDISEKPHFVWSDEWVTYDSSNDNVEKQEPFQIEDNIVNADSQEFCDLDFFCFENQELFSTEDDNFNVESQKISYFNPFSEEIPFVKSEGEAETMASFQDIVEKQDPSQTEENFFNLVSQGNCDPNHLPQNLHFMKPDEGAKMSPQAEVGALLDAVLNENFEGQKEMLAFTDGSKKWKETKTGFEEEADKVQNPSLEEETDKVQSPSLEEETDKVQSPSLGGENDEDSAPSKKAMEEEDEPNWKKLFLSGLENREKVLLAEYTSVLRNYKNATKKLAEIEKNNRENASETMVQLRDLKCTIAIKDEEIKSLRQKLRFLQTSFEGNLDTNISELKDTQQGRPHGDMTEKSNSHASNAQQPISNLLDDRNVEPAVRTNISIANGTTETYLTAAEDQEEDIKVILVDETRVSNIEEKFRRDIDELLEENLEFWSRFSMIFHQIQKFQTSIQDLQAETSKLNESKKQEGNTTTGRSLKSDARPIYKHLREIQSELSVWLENNALLKEELQYRFSSLCDIQEEILRVSKECSETEEVEFTSYQAAKFQGEVLNMQQENNKVADELQAGLDHVRGLQYEIEKTLSKLNDDFELSEPKKEHHHNHVKPWGSRSRIPLRSFIFGGKEKSIGHQSSGALTQHFKNNRVIWLVDIRRNLV